MSGSWGSAAERIPTRSSKRGSVCGYWTGRSINGDESMAAGSARAGACAGGSCARGPEGGVGGAGFGKTVEAGAGQRVDCHERSPEGVREGRERDHEVG